MKRKLLVLLLLYAGSAFPQAGVIDATFGTNGKVVTPLGANNNFANAITVQPDGKFLVGGAYLSNHGEFDFALARYSANGTLDATFGIDGKVVTGFLDNGHNYSYIHSIHLQEDGKIIVVGASGVASMFMKLALVRYNADGALDTGFGTNGKVISGLWPNSLPGNKLVFLPGGGFMVTSAKLYPDTQNYDIGIEKYTENGIIDTSFGTNGQVITSYGAGLNTSRSTPAAIALKADGKFVIAGAYLQGNIYRMALAQFNANGTLDTTFDADGKVITNFGTGTYSDGLEVFVAQDGKITMAGNVATNTSRDFGLVRYNTNGTLDTSFDTDGMVATAFAEGDNYNVINAVFLLENGKYLVVCGPAYGMLAASDFVIRRYNADASVDTAFGNNGAASVTFYTGENQSLQAAITPDGDIVVGGKAVSLNGEENGFAVAKFSENGTLDTAFGAEGKVTTVFEKGNDELAVLLALPDDKLVAVGSSAYREGNNTSRKHVVLSKYNADGSSDTTFGTAGKVYSVFGNNLNMAVTATLQPDDKILVGNIYSVFGQNVNSFEIIRYTANGSLDAGFGTAGRASVNFSPVAIVVQPDGKILVAGDAYLGNLTSSVSVARFNANGTLDTAFGTGGYASVLFAGSGFSMATAVLRPDGKIVVCESIIDSNGAVALMGVRFNTNGGLDTGFGVNGILTVSTVAGGDVFMSYKCFLQADGTIIVAGRALGGTVNFATIRLTADGAADTTYGTGGIIASALSEYRELRGVIMQPDGKFLVALSKYNQPQDSYDFKLRRFNTDGTFDADFSNMDGITTSFYNGYDEAFSLALQSDNKIVLAGSTHNGISKDFALVRYGNDLVSITEPDEVLGGITVYPNPVQGRLYIKAQGVEVIHYAVYNMLGQEVCKSTGSEVETAGFSKGIYTLKVTTGNGVVSRKFIKD